MASLSSYFVKDDRNMFTPQKNMIRGRNFRISILTPRLVRIEYDEKNSFENRPTSLVVNRNMGDVKFTTEQTDRSLIIKSEYFTLTYVKSASIKEGNIKIKVNGTDKYWSPGIKDVRNVGSINFSLDYLDDKNYKLDKGLYSFDGYGFLDDSDGYVLDKENFVKREKTTDIYVFIYKNDLGLCLQDYFNLTGYPSMVPRYSLGCWWYKNERYDMKGIDEIINKFKETEIPISVFLLGDSWNDKNNKFYYDKELFDIKNINNYYNSKEQVFGLTINPSLDINADDALYKDLSAHLNKYSDGRISFIPFNNNTINCFLNFILPPLINSGVKMFNIDYNDIKDKNSLFLLSHYTYAILNMQKRNVILSRNHGIAPHRYPIIFSGKTKVSWNTLKVLPYYNISASNMGISWIGHAIGGYHTGVEDDELFIRYIQFGVFSPIFILASEKGKYYKREPWKWNTLKLGVIKDYMVLRNKLIPYIYNEGFNYHKHGVPLVQPLYYKYPKIYDEPDYINQYFFGSKFMISPIVKKKNSAMNRVVQKVFIPNGVWYEFTTGKKYVGNKYYTGFYKEQDYPVFVKEGSIIPMSLDNDTLIPRNMEIQVFPAENGLYGSYELYEDNGDINQIDKNYIITKMNLDKAEFGYVFTVARKDGNYNIMNRNYVVRFRNMLKPEKIMVKYNGTIVDNYPYTNELKDLIVKVDNVNVFQNFEIDIVGKNIEIETVSLIHEEIASILEDLEIATVIKERIDEIIFDETIPDNKKRVMLHKLKKLGLEPKYIKMFIDLLNFMNIEVKGGKK